MRRRSLASRGSGDPLDTSSLGAAPSLELTIAGQNVALGQEEQHAGQVADRPQRLGRSLHLAGARAHFRARGRGYGGAPKGACPGTARRRTAAGLYQRASLLPRFRGWVVCLLVHSECCWPEEVSGTGDPQQQEVARTRTALTAFEDMPLSFHWKSGRRF